MAEDMKIYDVRNRSEFRQALKDGLERGDVMNMDDKPKKLGVFLEEIAGQGMHGFLAVEPCGLSYEGKTQRTFYDTNDGRPFLCNRVTFYKDSPEDEVKYAEQLRVIETKLG